MRKRKRKKTTEISTTFGDPLPASVAEIEKIEVAEFISHLPNAAPEVHMRIMLKDIEPELMMRFKGPDVIGDLAEILNAFRNKCWPDAEPLDFNKGFTPEE